MELLPAPVSPTTPITTGRSWLHKRGHGKLAVSCQCSRTKPYTCRQQLGCAAKHAVLHGQAAVDSVHSSQLSRPAPPALLHGVEVGQPGSGPPPSGQAGCACGAGAGSSKEPAASSLRCTGKQPCNMCSPRARERQHTMQQE